MKLRRRAAALLLTILAGMATAGLEAGSVTMAPANDTYVTVCGGPKSKRYHSSRNCPGLKKCSVTPRRISREAAIKKGYTPCRKCNPK